MCKDTMAAAARVSSLLARRARPQLMAAAGARRGLAAAAASLGETEVAISMLAAPVTKADLAGAGAKGTEGVGVVTAVGSKVKAVGVNDWVVPAGSGAVGALLHGVLLCFCVCRSDYQTPHTTRHTPAIPNSVP